MSRPATPWVQVPRPGPNPVLRLFCFPYAGAGATVFRGWNMPQQVEIAAVQPPGRENRLREPPFTDVHALADAAVEALEPWLDRPFAFFGHSCGALVAFEVARRLRRRGTPLPEHLFASGRIAPQIPLPPPHVHAMPHDELVATMLRFGGTPPEVLEHEELMRLVEPIIRADFSLGETYRYEAAEPLPVPISAYTGEGDAEVGSEGVEAWQAQTSAAFRMRVFPGDHFFINTHRQQVLDALQQELWPTLARLRPAAAHA